MNPTRLLPFAPLALGLVLALLPTPAPAQSSQLSLEANPFRGTVGYGRETAPGWHVGLQAGCGFPQLDRTLAPDEGDFFDLLHVGPFVRFARSDHLALALGARLGVADLHECRASDCLPGLYSAGSAAVLVGWRSFKVGPRLTAGWIREGGEPTTGFVGLAPVNFHVVYGW